MALRIMGNNPVASKIFIVGLIVLALMIPLTMLSGLIGERTQMRDQAYTAVAEGWGGRLTTGGPMLRIPFDTTQKNKEGEVIVTQHQLYVLPGDLNIEAKIEQEPEPRHIGIYQVPVYQVRLKMRGTFDGASIAGAASNTGTYHWGQAKLRLPLSDVRSVRDLSGARFGANELKFGPAAPGVYSAIEADVDLTAVQSADSTGFNLEIKLAGSRGLSLLPLAAVTNVKMASSWPHPQFHGAFLPAEHSISDAGFNASWQVLELNRQFRQSWTNLEVSDTQLLGAAFDVDLFQSVDVYQRSERAVKYALMFIALTFLSFYAWELLSAVAIHPMQYLLVGLALSAFYLLLIALTEHLEFWIAYWIGAVALIALLGTYIAGAMQSHKRGFIVAAMMSLVYGLLYMLVLSESYALLMGAIALFVVLAVVMLATRHVKWYASEA
jgi:inner membrane protein